MSRRLSLPALFVGALVALTAAGCGPGNNVDDDAGPGDDEDAGNDVVDECRAEAQSCQVDESECCEGLVCVPGVLNPDRGTCRLECGEIGPNDVPVEDDPSPCTGGRTCQTLIGVTPQGAFDPQGVVCLDQQDDRDALCEALGDPDACGEGRSCEVVDVAREADGSITFDLACKETCAFGTTDADDVCDDGEICFPSPLPVVPQAIQLTDPDDPNSAVTCNAEACAENPDTCACDAANGFECLDQTTQDICVRFAGHCGVPVDLVTSSDLTGDISNDIFCNNVDDHRYCDDREFRGLDNAAQVLCLPISQQSNDGICIAACSQEANDYNGDGQIGAGETAQQFACPASMECDLDFAVDVGLAARLTDDNGDPEACSQTTCPEGEPCATCSNDQARCMDFSTATAPNQFHCAVLFGTCQPPDAPTDGGTPVDAGADAGTVDAGDADAGDVDAGDADAGDVDAGDADAGDADAGDADAGDDGGIDLLDGGLPV